MLVCDIKVGPFYFPRKGMSNFEDQNNHLLKCYKYIILPLKCYKKYYTASEVL